MTFAFLFDIDGCLTLPDHDRSILDTDLIDQILELPYPTAFVTGRSDGWIKRHYQLQNRLNYLQIPTYIEFGLALLHHDNLIFQQTATEFLSVRDRFINLLAHETNHCGIYFEPDRWYDDYPDHGSLWVEDKHIQLSIAANSNITPNKVHDLVQSAWEDEDKGRILYHHLGVDVLPHNWSKSKATTHFINNLEEDEYEWYVFGDNASDREMQHGLSSSTFISTAEHASTTVRSILHDLNVIGD